MRCCCCSPGHRRTKQGLLTHAQPQLWVCSQPSCSLAYLVALARHVRPCMAHVAVNTQSVFRECLMSSHHRPLAHMGVAQLLQAAGAHRLRPLPGRQRVHVAIDGEGDVGQHVHARAARIDAEVAALHVVRHARDALRPQRSVSAHAQGRPVRLAGRPAHTWRLQTCREAPTPSLHC